jgi:peptidoglycan-N-acetylglucosamine deacetylase
VKGAPPSSDKGERGLVLNALAIDLEDWYHPELVRQKAGSSPASLVEEATRPLLDLFEKYGVKVSFFVVGDVAEKNPDFIRSLFEKGHEIGCHGFSHRPLWDLDVGLFREELGRFRDVIQRIVGPVEIKGFRAPTFSMDNRTKWALPVLREFGYRYDASVFPVKLNPLYGVNGAPTRPYRISFEDVTREDAASPLLEFPMSLLNLKGLKIPLAGGFYLRFFPFPVLNRGLRRMNRSQPFLLYFHPWEGSMETPRLKLSLYSRFITYYGIRTALGKVEGLLKRYAFDRVDRVLGLE